MQVVVLIRAWRAIHPGGKKQRSSKGFREMVQKKPKSVKKDCFVLFCMVFLRCMEPVVIQQQDQQLYVTSEPRREWTSITRNTHLWPLNGMAEIRTRATEMASEHQTDHANDGLKKDCTPLNPPTYLDLYQTPEKTPEKWRQAWECKHHFLGGPNKTAAWARPLDL